MVGCGGLEKACLIEPGSTTFWSWNYESPHVTHPLWCHPHRCAPLPHPPHLSACCAPPGRGGRGLCAGDCSPLWWWYCQRFQRIPTPPPPPSGPPPATGHAPWGQSRCSFHFFVPHHLSHVSLLRIVTVRLPCFAQTSFWVIHLSVFCIFCVFFFSTYLPPPSPLPPPHTSFFLLFLDDLVWHCLCCLPLVTQRPCVAAFLTILLCSYGSVLSLLSYTQVFHHVILQTCLDRLSLMHSVPVMLCLADLSHTVFMSCDVLHCCSYSIPRVHCLTWARPISRNPVTSFPCHCFPGLAVAYCVHNVCPLHSSLLDLVTVSWAAVSPSACLELTK